MLNPSDTLPQTNPGFSRMFAPGRLTLGVLFAIESYPGDAPTMVDQIRLAKRAEQAGFAALGVRDVPLRDPSFGDLGQIFDPWTWLGYVAGQTSSIALFTAAIVLPLRHPLHTAKAAASIDRLTGGRLVMGIASGDRAIEFPAFGVEHAQRGALFQEQVAYLENVWGNAYPQIHGTYGTLHDADLVPKPVARRVPLIVTGHSQQSIDWIARKADGWITYPRRMDLQVEVIRQWHDAVAATSPGTFKPFAQPYHIDLTADPDVSPTPIHGGHRLGRSWLMRHLETLERAGANHVLFNLKYGNRAAEAVLEELATHVTPRFPALGTA
ncbi:MULTISPECIES: LLM class oxidoreductase [unclassified Cupriavidus]|uniref:LLM class oxidoreductase n=1 Tax=unclassified Cupriavidus TaxID=2640874 RepID=UPI000FBD442C|nr:LLM class oxidoreductase [Cupriavidus sp.]